MLGQDDPSKCTAAKLIRFGLAERTRYIGYNTILLNPYSKDTLSRQDGLSYNSMCAVDCSWEKAGDVLIRHRELRGGRQRRLPMLLAANPTNYSKLGKLSSVEALAGSLIILGYKDRGIELLNKFKWGPTFLILNNDLLDDYSDADGSEKIMNVENEYFGHL
jgi:rRNA small subunit aminocarboxypropyltransferase